MVVVRVTTVEGPLLAQIDRDATVSQRVPGEGDQQQLRRQAGQLAHGLEAEPALAPREGA